MASGYGVNIGDWALLGGVAIAGILIYSTVGKPLKQVGEDVASVTQTIADDLKLLDLNDNGQNNLFNSWFQSELKSVQTLGKLF